jgi:DNA-binding MarR family transcriptional regulator
MLLGYTLSVHQNIREAYYMTSRVTRSGDEARRRRRSVTAIKDSMRELSVQLSLLSHQVGGRLELKDVDLGCLDLISRHGPLSPSALARMAGLHPATVTGILDRLERGRWVARERDPGDRRAVVVRALRDRGAEVFRLYGGMNASLDRLLAGYGDDELELLSGFLRRTIDAGRDATDALAGEP